MTMQAAGWALLAGGLFGSALTAAVIPDNHLRPVGLSVLSVSVIGVGIAAVGVRRMHDAVRRYNEMADETGLCTPVW
jgi:hypothetical protein